MIWRCPKCRRELGTQGENLECTGCGTQYPVIGGVPDFRSPDATGEYNEVDLALSIVHGPAAGDADALVHAFFVSRESARTGGKKYTARRIAGTIASFSRLDREVDQWLTPLAGSGGPLLDVGCGLGAAIAAFGTRSVPCIGIDNRLDLLIVTRAILQARLSEADVPQVAAADALHLPLGDSTLAGTIYYDVVEHLPDVEQALKEARRVTRAGGWIAISTPNRFSVAAEPHVGVWGVGWLPRQFQAAFATRASGVDYSGTSLLSARELRRLIDRHTDFDMRFSAPAIPGEAVETFGRRRSMLARVYNSLVAHRPTEGLMIHFGPFFHAIGRRSSSA
jgi:SAM-dependent methyltransferase